MAQPLSRYHSRLPRYLLQTQDNTLIRFAGPQQTPWEEGTEIHNISLSGLAFTVPAELSPLLGEVIKIEFEVPGASRMACFGMTTRMDPQPSGNMLVGVKFYKMDLAQRIFLAQGLAQKLKDQHIRKNEEKKNWRSYLKPGIGLFGMLICLAMSFKIPEISRQISALIESILHK